MVIKAKCKNCGCDAPVDQFKLHYSLRMMVCDNCFHGKTQRQEERMKKSEEKPPRPPGWDAEDEYLERLSRLRREENQAQFSKIAGTDLVKCICPHCRYSFKYDPGKKTPKTCPYCDVEVPKLKLFNL